MAVDIGRRKLVTLLGGSAVAWPIAALAQTAVKPSTNVIALGDLGGKLANATAVSANGSVVVGNILYGPAFERPASRAFRWTATSGVQDLGTFGGQSAYATSASADGSVIAGQIEFENDKILIDHVFRWTAAGGVRDLGTFGGQSAFATGISADGAVIVGRIHISGGSSGTIATHAFRWTEAGGARDFGASLGQETGASGVSANGSVVVGRIGPTFRGRAFRWTEAEGVQDLGAFGGRFSAATAVSADGSVIVGYIERESSNKLVEHITAWTKTGNIHHLDAQIGYASAVSADGSVIVGNYSMGLPNSGVRLADDPLHGFRWTRSGGLNDLGTFGGVPLRAVAVSADGSIVVGNYGAGLGYAKTGVFVASYRK